MRCDYFTRRARDRLAARRFEGQLEEQLTRRPSFQSAIPRRSRLDSDSNRRDSSRLTPRQIEHFTAKNGSQAVTSPPVNFG